VAYDGAQGAAEEGETMNIRKAMAYAAIATGFVVGIGGMAPASAASAESAGARATVNYRIEQTTGNVSDGGTDSTVHYRLCSATACTPDRTLDDPNKDDRERGNTDTYDREWEGIGRLTHILIKQETNGSAWYLDRVRITYSGRTDTFLYDNWLPRGNWVTIRRT
jgi:PLAT/LH2 domain